MLWVDKAAKAKYNVFDWNLELFNHLFHGKFDIAFKKLQVVVFVVFLPSQNIDLVEVLLVVFAQITYQVLVDDLIANLSSFELTKFELNSVLV